MGKYGSDNGKASCTLLGWRYDQWVRYPPSISMQNSKKSSNKYLIKTIIDIIDSISIFTCYVQFKVIARKKTFTNTHTI